MAAGCGAAGATGRALITNGRSDNVFQISGMCTRARMCVLCWWFLIKRHIQLGDSDTSGATQRTCS